MKSRIDTAESLFRSGYNCAQSVFAAFSDLYGIDKDRALLLSASFGGGVGRMREICGAVSGMSMIAGLETGSAKEHDDEGKKYNYEVVRKLSEEFKNLSGSLICRELLGLDKEQETTATPQPRDAKYYNTRPCEQLVKDAAGIVEKTLYALTIEPVHNQNQLRAIAELAEAIWHEHYDSIIGKDQVDYMLEKFQSETAMVDQIEHSGYRYYNLVTLGGLAGYFAIREDNDALFLSKIYIAKKFRSRGYSNKALDFMKKYCAENNLNRIWLTVNKNNTATIQIYEKLGFSKSGTQVADIGSGYIMDDYTMEMTTDYRM